MFATRRNIAGNFAGGTRNCVLTISSAAGHALLINEAGPGTTANLDKSKATDAPKKPENVANSEPAQVNVPKPQPSINSVKSVREEAEAELSELKRRVEAEKHARDLAEERARQVAQKEITELKKRLDAEKQARQQAEERAAALISTKRDKGAQEQETALALFDGIWVSVSPPGPHVIFNRIALGAREASLPVLGQAAINVSDGKSGSNFSISGAGFTCYYLVLSTDNRRRMVWESKGGDSVCLASAVFERADPVAVNSTSGR